jgi:hypothetical protein
VTFSLSDAILHRLAKDAHADTEEVARERRANWQS